MAGRGVGVGGLGIALRGCGGPFRGFWSASSLPRNVRAHAKAASTESRAGAKANTCPNWEPRSAVRPERYPTVQNTQQPKSDRIKATAGSGFGGGAGTGSGVQSRLGKDSAGRITCSGATSPQTPPTRPSRASGWGLGRARRYQPPNWPNGPRRAPARPRLT